jgi:hypothetical protein
MQSVSALPHLPHDLEAFVFGMEHAAPSTGGGGPASTPASGFGPESFFPASFVPASS